MTNSTGPHPHFKNEEQVSRVFWEDGLFLQLSVSEGEVVFRLDGDVTPTLSEREQVITKALCELVLKRIERNEYG